MWCESAGNARVRECESTWWSSAGHCTHIRPNGIGNRYTLPTTSHMCQPCSVAAERSIRCGVSLADKAEQQRSAVTPFQTLRSAVTPHLMLRSAVTFLVERELSSLRRNLASCRKPLHPGVCTNAFTGYRLPSLLHGLGELRASDKSAQRQLQSHLFQLSMVSVRTIVHPSTVFEVRVRPETYPISARQPGGIGRYRQRRTDP